MMEDSHTVLWVGVSNKSEMVNNFFINQATGLKFIN